MIADQVVAKVAPVQRVKLTKRVVDGATYPADHHGKPCILWDRELPRLGLRIFPSGRKSFVVFYRTTHGQKRLFTVGTSPALTVAEARIEARKKLGDVARGEDPAHERKAARATCTVTTLAEAFVDQYAKLHKRSWKVDQQRIKDWIKPAWGTRPAILVARADVATLHREIGATSPTNANRTVMLVSKLYTWGEEQGFVPEGHPNPARRFKKFEERSRDRFLTATEVKTLFEKIDTDEKSTLYIRAFFRLAFLLGTRKRELLTAKWSYVDVENGLLKLPSSATKGKRPLVLPLSVSACEILASLPREAGNPHIFPGAKVGKPLVNVEDAWNRARKSANLADVHFHDVRRTVGSWIAQRTGNLELVANVLNHRDPRTTKIYARFLPSQVRVALEDHSAAMIAATAPRATEPTP